MLERTARLLADFETHLSAGTTSPKTVALRMTYVRRMIADLDPLAASIEDVEKWVYAHNWAQETTNSAIISIRALFRWLLDSGRREDDPTGDLALTTKYAARTVRRVVTDRRKAAELPADRARWLDGFRSFMERRNHSPVTVKNRCGYARRMMADLDPLRVTAFELEEWVYSHGWRPESINGAVTAVRKFFKWMQLAGHRQDNPAQDIETVTIPRKRPRIADDRAIAEGIAESDLETQIMILLAAECGLRRAEIARVHHDDISGRWLTVHGKGGRERQVQLTPHLVERIWRLPGSGYLFPGRTQPAPPTHGTYAMFQAGCRDESECPGHPDTAKSCRQANREAQARYRAGIRQVRLDGSRHVTPETVYNKIHKAVGNTHSLRHRAATAVYRGTGNDLRVTQEFLGHASPAMTARYVHVTDRDLELAAIAAQLQLGGEMSRARLA